MSDLDQTDPPPTPGDAHLATVLRKLAAARMAGAGPIPIIDGSTPTVAHPASRARPAAASTPPTKPITLPKSPSVAGSASIFATSGLAFVRPLPPAAYSAPKRSRRAERSPRSNGSRARLALSLRAAFARLCVATGTELHLVRPMGFVLDDKEIRRSAMDYWPRLKLTVHDDTPALVGQAPPASRWVRSGAQPSAQVHVIPSAVSSSRSWRSRASLWLARAGSSGSCRGRYGRTAMDGTYSLRLYPGSYMGVSGTVEGNDPSHLFAVQSYLDLPAGFAIDTKHVKTQVMVENGGTVVLG